MRLKVTIGRTAAHTDAVSAVGWSTSDELLSCADDHALLLWNQISGEHTQLATLPQNLYPTSIHWYPRGLTGGGKKGISSSTATDIFVLSSTDGRFYLISKGGRVEKTVEAHTGAVLSARWSHDGSSLLTVGEDGAAKIWSRSGMLRSTLSQNSNPVYSGAWLSDNQQIVYCCGSMITIKSLQANVKPIQWKAHDGVVLTLDCNPSTNLIASGGEDFKYKIWDIFGRILYSSIAHENPISSVCWSPDGQQLAVGGFNTIRLCDKAGWSHCLDKIRVGGIYNMAWSPDATQIAAACASGHVLFANVIEQRAEWNNFEAVQRKRKTIEVREVTSDAREKLELRDRMTKMVLGWNHLLVTTPSQIYIYSSKNWNTPTIADLKEGSVSLIILAEKCFLLVDGSSVTVYNYDHKPQCFIKFAGMRTDVLSDRTVGLSNDTVAIKDQNDDKVIHLFDVGTGKPLGDGKITHTQEILSLCIDQCGPSTDRRVAYIDKNNDLFIYSVKSYGGGQRLVKLGIMVQDCRFNDETNMLVGLGDNRLTLWPYPSAAFSDRELLPKSIIEKDIESLGKSPMIIGFYGNRVSLRKADGAVISCGLPPFPAILYDYLIKNKWDLALKLCRNMKDDKLWSTLAAMAAFSKNLNTAEIAYAAIGEAEKVQFLSTTKSITNKDIKNAELALFCGNVQDAEGIYLQSGHIFRAIMLNIILYRWDRALELAVKHKQHIDTVIAYRQKYLQDFDKKETRPKFLQNSQQIEIDWDTIEENMQAEYDKEHK